MLIQESFRVIFIDMIVYINENTTTMTK